MRLTSENRVIWMLGKIGQFILLNFLILLCCIPVFTAGAAFAAGFCCLSKMHEPEGMILTSEFFRAFRKNFKEATGAWLVLCAVMIMGGGDLFYALRVSESVNVFFALFGVLLLLLSFSMAFWVFFLISKYENTVYNHLKNALILTFGKLPRTLLLWCVWGIPAAIGMLWQNWMVLLAWLCIVCGIAALQSVSWLVLRNAFESSDKCS